MAVAIATSVVLAADDGETLSADLYKTSFQTAPNNGTAVKPSVGRT
jgi:hypothetical protein